MNPIEISDYKRTWLPGHTVGYCSDLMDRAIRWCKDNVEKHQFQHVKYVDSYEHEMRFECVQDKEGFIEFIESIDPKFVYNR